MIGLDVVAACALCGWQMNFGSLCEADRALDKHKADIHAAGDNMFSASGSDLVRYWVLSGQMLVAVSRLQDWSQWLKANCSRLAVARTIQGNVKVCTTFIGYSIGETQGPWETLVFGGPFDDLCKRAWSIGEAVSNHSEICMMAFGVAFEQEFSGGEMPKPEPLPRRGIKL